MSFTHKRQKQRKLASVTVNDENPNDIISQFFCSEGIGLKKLYDCKEVLIQNVKVSYMKHDVEFAFKTSTKSIEVKQHAYILISHPHNISNKYIYWNTEVIYSFVDDIIERRVGRAYSLKDLHRILTQTLVDLRA